LIIVARDQPDLWQSLKEHFATTEDIQAILDRRRWERRQPPRIEMDVYIRQYVIARPRR
jgi:hypothetical protein